MEETELRRILAVTLKKAANYQKQKEKRCVIVQNFLVNGKRLSAAEAIHLKNCKDCQFLKRLRNG